MNISAENLTKLATSILGSARGNTAKSSKVARRLVDANLTGHDSHGVGMIPAYVDGIVAQQLNPEADVEIVQDRGPFLLVDGQRGFGHIVAEQAMNLAIERAQTNYFAVLSLRNSFHLGRLGDWVIGARWRRRLDLSVLSTQMCNLLVPSWHPLAAARHGL